MAAMSQTATQGVGVPDRLSVGVAARLSRQADRFRDLLMKSYGPERGRNVKYAEAFEACEYGAPLDERARALLFPFAD